MKRSIVILLLVILSMPLLTAQNSKTNSNTSGSWKFDAPYAPEGYNTGTIVVNKFTKADSVTMTFTGSGYKIPGENVKATNDSVYFSVFLEGQDIRIYLKSDDQSKMSGKAVYSEGEVPLTLTRMSDSSATDKK